MAPAAKSARAIARAELTTSIKDAARAQLGEVGPAELSLRAVARDLGLASSALYRYFASRDELLTALIVDAFDAVGIAAETTRARERSRGADAGATWLAVCRAVRAWALAHPNEWALIYGSPVPGYAAPDITVGPATRVGLVLADVLFAALEAGSIDASARPLPAPSEVTAQVLESIGRAPTATDDVVERSLLLWISLVGTISFELFGHLKNVVTTNDRFFDRMMVVAAEGVGLRLPLDDD